MILSCYRSRVFAQDIYDLSVEINRSTRIRFNKSARRRRSGSVDCRQSRSSRGTIALARPLLESGNFVIPDSIALVERNVLVIVLDLRSQMCSKDRDAAGNVTEPEGHNVDVIGIVLRPRRIEAAGVDVEDIGGPGGAEVKEGERTGEGAGEGGEGTAKGGGEGGKDQAEGSEEAGERGEEEGEEGSEGAAEGSRRGPPEGREVGFSGGLIAEISR